MVKIGHITGNAEEKGSTKPLRPLILAKFNPCIHDMFMAKKTTWLSRICWIGKIRIVNELNINNHVLHNRDWSGRNKENKSCNSMDCVDK